MVLTKEGNAPITLLTIVIATTQHLKESLACFKSLTLVADMQAEGTVV